MFVSYTIKNYNFKETSKGRGIISYLIADANGNKRKVSALAHTGFRGKVKSVRPINKRETPLVEALLKKSINDKIEIDFSEFNKNNPREDSAKEIGVREKEIPDDFKDATIYDLDDISENKFRLLQLAALGALVLTAILFVMNGFFSS